MLKKKIPTGTALLSIAGICTLIVFALFSPFSRVKFDDDLCLGGMTRVDQWPATGPALPTFEENSTEIVLNELGIAIQIPKTTYAISCRNDYDTCTTIYTHVPQNVIHAVVSPSLDVYGGHPPAFSEMKLVVSAASREIHGERGCGNPELTAYDLKNGSPPSPAHMEIQIATNVSDPNQLSEYYPALCFVESLQNTDRSGIFKIVFEKSCRDSAPSSTGYYMPKKRLMVFFSYGGDYRFLQDPSKQTYYDENMIKSLRLLP